MILCQVPVLPGHGPGLGAGSSWEALPTGQSWVRTVEVGEKEEEEKEAFNT